MSTNLVTLETKEEIRFLEQQCRSKEWFTFGTSVHVGLDMMTVEWDNGRPLTIAFYREVYHYGKHTCRMECHYVGRKTINIHFVKS